MAVTDAPAGGLDICIAGLGVTFDVDDAELSQHLAERYAGFEGTSAGPVLRVRVETCAGMWMPPPEPDLLGRPWLDVSGDDPAFRIVRADFDGTLDLDAGTGHLRCQPRDLSVDGFLRVALSLLLLRDGGMLLHAASVASGARGLVFTGASGAGKTTVSRLAGNRPVLTDETTIIRRNGVGFTVHGNPFPGELDRSGPDRAYPVSAIYLLVQDSEARLAPLTRSDAVAVILANTFLHARGAVLAARALETAVAIAASVPVARLHFAPDVSIWEILE